MLFAINKDGKKVFIDNATRKEEYFCPCCGDKLILKLGEIRVHHFSHPSERICCDTWHYDMTDWHCDWQNRFPQEYQEVVKTLNGQKHRADVLIEEAKVVFEFQHSPLSALEFNERNAFYNELGYKVIWVFDVEDQYWNNQLDNYKANIWSWKNPRRTFDLFDFKNKNVEIFLQLESMDVELIKVTWCTENNGFSRFTTDGYSYDYDSIVHMFDKEIKNEKNEFKLSELYDKLIELYSKDHTTYFFGCPISGTHQCANSTIDIPKSKYNEIMPCMECEFCLIKFHYEEMICKKRFLDLNLDANTIVQIEGRDKNGFINKISYILNDEKKYIDLITYEQNISKSVFTLWEENNCSIATFRNVRTGKYIRIVKNPRDQFLKYHKVFGYFSSDKYSFSKKSVELFGVEKPEWLLEWFKTD